MDADAGFSMEDFSLEMGEYEVKKVRQFDRMWRVGPGGSVCEKMCVHDGKVYFGSANRNVYCIDAATGGLVWKYATEGMIIISSPVTWEGKVYVGSYDRCVYCLDAENGHLFWKFETQGEIACTPAVSGGIVYCGSRDQNMYALDAKSGRLLWKFRTQEQVVSCPAVSEGRVYFGSFDRFFYCIDAESGRLIWKTEAQDEIFNINEPLLHGGLVHFGCFDGSVWALSVRDGSVAWKRRLCQYGFDECPILYGNRMYISTRDGYFACLDLNGEIVWKFRMNEVDGTCACFHEGRLYVGAGDYNMYCLGLDGRVVWKHKTNGYVWWYPAVHGGNVIFSSWDCNVYAVSIDTHELAWKFQAPGSPSELPPGNDVFEFELKIGGNETEQERKSYSLNLPGSDAEVAGAYKSKVTYRMSNHYASKGKYQVDSDEERF